MLSVRFYRNLGFTLWIIAMISFGAFTIGKLDLVYMLIINISVIVGEMILLLFMVRRVIKSRIIGDALSPKVLIPKGRFNDTQIHADTYIFNEPITSTNPMRQGVFRICIELTDKFIECLELSVVRTFEREISEQKFDTTHCLVGGHILHINVYPKEKVNYPA